MLSTINRHCSIIRRSWGRGGWVKGQGVQAVYTCLSYLQSRRHLEGNRRIQILEARYKTIVDDSRHQHQRGGDYEY